VIADIMHLICVLLLMLMLLLSIFLQCFDTVGWVTTRASTCENLTLAISKGSLGYQKEGSSLNLSIYREIS